ncbi:MAG: energy transducer TonB [Gammaproteobacteria bacterium]
MTFNLRRHRSQTIRKASAIAVSLLVSTIACAGTAPAPVAATAIPPLLKEKVVPFAPASGSEWTEGCVLLRYDVSNAGVPVNIRILASAPDHVLERSAVSALEQWRYQPSMRNGQPVVAHDLQQLLLFDTPGSASPPPYALCGGSRSGQAEPAQPRPAGLPAQLNLDVTRPAVMQTFTQPADSGYMPKKGNVTLRFCVNAQGHTENIHIVHSVPYGVFDQMALGIIRAALFKPHELQGYPVTACGITQPIVFEAAHRN